MKDTWYYLISIGFVLIAFFIIITSPTESEDFLNGILCLLFFGGGALVTYFLKKEDRTKIIANETTIIYESRKRVFIYFLGSLIFVIAGFFMMRESTFFSEFKFNSNGAFIGGLLSFLFFGLILIYSFFSIIKPKKVIEISNNGIFIQYGFLKSLIFISYEDIIEIVETNFMSNVFIAIFLENPRKYIRNESFFDTINSKLIGTPFNINSKVTDYSSTELLDFLTKKLEENTKQR